MNPSHGNLYHVCAAPCLLMPLIVDLYCGQGGATKGYLQAGFGVIGVDSEPQPRYPGAFIKSDALEFLKRMIDDPIPGVVAVHASPPCKLATTLKAFSAKHHEDMIPQTRELLIATGLPYVIENVPGAELVDPVMLCGSTFDLGVRRHRLFESNQMIVPPRCDHRRQERESPGYDVTTYHDGERRVTRTSVLGVYGGGRMRGVEETKLWAEAMRIDWMTRDGLSQAIPPAYTRYIGVQLLAQL